MEPEHLEMLDAGEQKRHNELVALLAKATEVPDWRRTEWRLALSYLVKLASVRLEVKEYEYLFDLHHKRERPWIEQWQRETGHEHMLPDYGGLLEWLSHKAEQRDAFRKERDIMFNQRETAWVEHGMLKAERDRLKEQLDVALAAINEMNDNCPLCDGLGYYADVDDDGVSREDMPCSVCGDLWTTIRNINKIGEIDG